MARLRDESKRAAIIGAAKHLFARQGFHNTSISDIKKETGFPVGTIYTYFEGKDHIMETLITEGWEDLHARLAEAFKPAHRLEEKIAVLTDIFLPELLRDTDLINILLTEALELTHIGEKLDVLMNLVWDLRSSIETESPLAAERVFPADNEVRTAVVVYFLGILNAARLSRSGTLGITVTDIRTFLRSVIYQGLRTTQG